MHFKVTKGKPGRSDITMDKHRGKGNNVHPDRKKRKVFDPVKDKEARRRREQQDLSAKFAEILEWGYHLAKTPRELPTVASTDS
jgi:hypothetical protein